MVKKFDAATAIQDIKQFGEFGDVNPSITDSATYTFMSEKAMIDTFHGEGQGCFFIPDIGIHPTNICLRFWLKWKELNPLG